MTDEDKRRLMEWMGEKWNQFNDTTTGQRKNQAFKSPDDLVAVQEALVKKGETDKFYSFAWKKFINGQLYIDVLWGYYPPREFFKFINYLNSRSPDGTFVLCRLAGEYVKEKG